MSLTSALLVAGCDDDDATGPANGSLSAIPQLLAPAEGAVLDNGCADRSNGVEWQFDWSDVPHATEYQLFVMGRNARIPAVDVTVDVSSRIASSPQSFIVEFHRFGWRWRVRAKVRWNCTEWTSERTFDVEPLDSDC